jgi:hypothetical protein
MVIATGDLVGQGLENLASSVQSRGWATAPHGLLHLRGGANALGLDQIGCQPQSAPGGGKLEGGKSYAESWGEFCNKPGQDYREITKSGGSGTLLAVGCDPMAEEGAKKPACLIACASAPNATTEKADIVFPLSTWVESHGVFVNTDGTIQLSRQAVMPVGESQPAWAIASALVKAIRGGDAPYKTTRQVFAEIGQLNPAFLGRSYRDFEAPGEAHWSYPQQAGMGMPRPDLSAIPVPQPDTPMWMPVANTGSRVEKAGRLTRGESPPSVPGQSDPRRIAALLGLAHDHLRHPDETEVAAAAAKAGYVPLRVMATSSAQPAGPTPSKRHQKIGVGPHLQMILPGAVTAALIEDPDEPEENISLSSLEIVAPAKPAQPETKESIERDKSDEGKGDSNVAVVDEVTKDGQAERNAGSPGAEAKDSAPASDTGLVLAKEGEAPESSAETPSEANSGADASPPAKAAAEAGDTAAAEAETTSEAEAVPEDLETGSASDDKNGPEAAVTEASTPSEAKAGKAKKGKRKGAKEKK